MPNGEEKNWVRLCAAIDGFRARHKAWPTKVRVFPGFIDEMREYVLGPANYSVLEKNVQFIEDDSPIIAEDDGGRHYSYGDEGFSKEKPDVSAEEWLGINCIV